MIILGKKGIVNIIFRKFKVIIQDNPITNLQNTLCCNDGMITLIIKKEHLY